MRCFQSRGRVFREDGFEAAEVKNKVLCFPWSSCEVWRALIGAGGSGRVCSEVAYLAWGSEPRASSSEREAGGGGQVSGVRAVSVYGKVQ